MAFTLITSDIVFFDAIEFQGPTPYFHPEDIAVLLNQEDAIAVTTVGAKIKNHPPCLVLLGVENFELNSDTNELSIVRLDKRNLNFIGLPCPPYNNNGGVFELTPRRQEGVKVINKSTKKPAFE